MNTPSAHVAGRDRLAGFCQRVALVHVLLPLAIVAVAVAGFAAGTPLGRQVLPVAVLIALIGLRMSSASRREAWLVAIATAAVHAGAGIVAALSPDRSWDGVVYHQDAVLRLAAGWNPVFEDAGAYGLDNAVYVGSYPHASWIAGAAVLMNTGSIEAGKLFNLTLLVAAAAQVCSVLLRLTKLSWPAAAAVAVLVALNPVSIYQGTTFYVDGLMASGLTIIAAALVLHVATQERPALLVGVLAACFVGNLKLTGPVFAAVLLVAAALAAWWRHGIAGLRRLAWSGALVAVGAGLLLGYSPYVRNLLEHGHPLYPVFGAPQYVDPSRFRPVNLNDQGRVGRFLTSNFSRTEAVRAPQRTSLKLPLAIAPGERRGIYAADVESGGFGPLYGAMLLLGAAAAGVLLANRGTRRVGAVALLIVAAIAASVLVHAETWWARYVPQAWLMPLVPAAACAAAARVRVVRGIGVALVVLAAVNVAVVAANVGYQQWRFTQATQAALEAMRAAPQPVAVYLGGFRPLQRRLREAGVAFTTLREAPDRSAVRHVIPAPGGRAFWIE